jgi:DMSO/TMAO reductase YedYZ molybdopterin-dependent catalytic subunit
MKRKFHFRTGTAGGFGRRFSRRELLRSSLIAGGAMLVGFDRIAWPRLLQGSAGDQFAGGKPLGTVAFSKEATVPMETALSAELDARLYTDLSKLTPENAVTPTEKFYVRTGASELLDPQRDWRIHMGGIAAKSSELNIDDLKKMAKPMGIHLMECAGNARSVHFGLMSVADWAGVRIAELFENSKVNPSAARVLISGFDTYATKSISSVPGASWIFIRDDLRTARAFLATEMNGSPLTKDHGAPVRLVVPGWYGCACIKWVNEITIVDDTAAATSQMQEYAARTMQSGVPRLAREYKPATVEQAAMPIRIEEWLVDEKIKYKVVGILWGGSRPLKTLEIRFNPDEDYVTVDNFQHTANDPWSFWTHAWTPKQTGSYLIRLRVNEPGVAARRLDLGYYMRSVEITEI